MTLIGRRLEEHTFWSLGGLLNIFGGNTGTAQSNSWLGVPVSQEPIASAFTQIG